MSMMITAREANKKALEVKKVKAIQAVSSLIDQLSLRIKDQSNSGFTECYYTAPLNVEIEDFSKVIKSLRQFGYTIEHRARRSIHISW